MSKGTIDLQVDKSVCEAEGCSAIATEKIEVTAGQYKVVLLSLCHDCVSKFEDIDCPNPNSVLCEPCSPSVEV